MVIELQTKPVVKGKPMKRNLQIIGGVVAVLVGLGIIMPAAALWRTQGLLPAMSVALLLFGVADCRLGRTCDGHSRHFPLPT